MGEELDKGHADHCEWVINRMDKNDDPHFKNDDPQEHDVIEDHQKHV